jgi:hypothetical protein
VAFAIRSGLFELDQEVSGVFLTAEFLIETAINVFNIIAKID